MSPEELRAARRETNEALVRQAFEETRESPSRVNPDPYEGGHAFYIFGEDGRGAITVDGNGDILAYYTYKTPVGGTETTKTWGVVSDLEAIVTAIKYIRDVLWLAKMNRLEEERGDIVPGGAQGGVVAKYRRKHPK